MDITGIIIAIALVGGVGIFIGIFLSFSAKAFYVDVDPKETAVLEALPGNNCGGCGYPGCSGLASAIAKGEAPVSGCPVGGKPVADKIAAIMGVDAGEVKRMVAYVKCKGTCDKATEDYQYSGVKDCRMAAMAPGKGAKTCNYGCLGYGSCASVCASGAISIVDGIAVVDKDKCTGCQKCVKTCPLNVIEMVPYDNIQKVGCSSKDKGPVVMKGCKAGCVGCMMCVKACPVGAVEVNDFLAHIDYDKCIGCGACAQKCPKKVIEME